MILERMGLSAWITDSEGTPLPEYKVKMIDDKTIELVEPDLYCNHPPITSLLFDSQMLDTLQ